MCHMAESAVDQHGPTATRHTQCLTGFKGLCGETTGDGVLTSKVCGTFFNLKTSILSIFICSIEQENNLGLCYWRASWSCH